MRSKAFHQTYLTLLGIACISLAVRPAAAASPGIGFTSSAVGVEDNAYDATSSPTGSYTLGFGFTALAPDQVTALGYFNDPSFNPNAPFGSVNLGGPASGSYSFTQSHDVGLYQVAGEISTLVASATVTSSGTPNGYFLYQSITPVQLVTGADYVLAGVTGPNDPYIYAVQDPNQPNSVGITMNDISYTQDLFDPSSTLAQPNSNDPGSEVGFFGPNLLLSSTLPTPEPSSALSIGVLLAMTSGALFIGARRRRGVGQQAS